MKFNGKTIKVGLAFIVIIGVVVWSATLLRPKSYNGSNLSFDIGGGTISMANPSAETIPVKVISDGSRSFKISSTIEDVSGSSTREGSGGSISQLFEFELPSGNSEFTIERGNEAKFIAETPIRLQATVNPVSSETFRTAMITIGVIILAALYYASNVTEHHWIRLIPGMDKGTDASNMDPAVETASSRQGQVAQSYGDNRAKKTD